jgi:signal transduction histidine kinase
VPRRMPIRLKLAAALAVPICALLLVSALEVAQSVSHARETEEQTELATAAIGPGGLIASLQNERNFGALYILGFEEATELPVESFDEAAAATDEAIDSFRAEINAKGGDVESTYEPALDTITSDIGEYREFVTGMTGERNESRTDVSDPFFGAYTSLIDTLFDANGQVALAIDDPTLRRGVELTDLASHQIENLARTQRVVLLAGVTDGLHDPAEIAETAGLVGQIEANLDQTQGLGVGRYGPATADAMDDFEASGYLPLVEGAIDSGEVKLIETLNALSREEDEGFNGYRIAINEEIEARADELNEDASASQWRYIGLALLALLVAGLVTWLVSRSITKPLRSLTRQAKQMAERRLPEAVTDILETPLGEDVTVPSVEPVRVNTRDEVSDVADALNTVQDSALDLAVEQAVLRRNIADSFVNLGRRNQNLLGRQLDFITELESNETDPDNLANLFRLDHLATRMRRNAESLLVLAGIEPPRQWAAPVRLTDVIRAALGEVEDYQRVAVRGVEPATILGSAAADLAHLLAELIENALVFSPPDQTVDIRGRNRPDGYTLAVIDSGLGMPAGDVAAANRRLAGAESFTIAPSKYLGHYVAGNLAARHDIEVRLDNSPGNGITATIDIPATLLTTDTDLAAPVTPPHGTPRVAQAGHPTVSTAAPVGTAHPDAAWLTQPAPYGQPAAATPPPVDPGAVPPAPPLHPAAFDPGRPGRPPEPVGPPTRTASGLVKRARRTPDQPLGARLDGDLLASLSSVTGNLPPQPGQPPVAPGQSPTTPTTPTPPSGPIVRPRGDEPADGRPRSWPAPPGARPAGPVPPLPANGRGNGAGRPSLPTRRGADGGAPAAPAASAGAAGDPGATTSGLARRVRGAQLPTTQPMNLRRNQETPSARGAGYRLGDNDNANGHMLGNGSAGGYTNGQANGHANGRSATGEATGDHEASSAARSVYGFLTSFTQGVQRGLEEARRDPTTPKENS